MSQPTEESLAGEPLPTESKDYKFTTVDLPPWVRELAVGVDADEEHCRAFMWSLTNDYGLIWHPDTRFDQYVELESGEPVFSPRACDLMDGAMGECFKLFGNERVYEVALEVWNNWHAANQRKD